MNQTILGYEPFHKHARKDVFLEETERVVTWTELVTLIQPHARGAHQPQG